MKKQVSELHFNDLAVMSFEIVATIGNHCRQPQPETLAGVDLDPTLGKLGLSAMCVGWILN